MSSIEGLEIGYRFAGSGEVVLACHSREYDDLVLVQGDERSGAGYATGARYCVFEHADSASSRRYYYTLAAARADFVARLIDRGVDDSAIPTTGSLEALSLFAKHPSDGTAVLRGADAMAAQFGDRWYERVDVLRLVTSSAAFQLGHTTASALPFIRDDNYGMGKAPRQRAITAPLWRALIMGLREIDQPTETNVAEMTNGELRRHIAKQTMAYNGGCDEGKKEFLRSIGLGNDIPLGTVHGGVVTIEVPLSRYGVDVSQLEEALRRELERQNLPSTTALAITHSPSRAE